MARPYQRELPEELGSMDTMVGIEWATGKTNQICREIS